MSMHTTVRPAIGVYELIGDRFELVTLPKSMCLRLNPVGTDPMNPSVTVSELYDGGFYVHIIHGKDDINRILSEKFNVLTYVRDSCSAYERYVYAQEASVEDLIIADIYGTYINLVDGENKLPLRWWGIHNSHTVIVDNGIIMSECITTSNT